MPDFLFTETSATTAAIVPANPPRAIPRPVTMLPVCAAELATLPFQFEILATSVRTFFQRSQVNGRLCVVSFALLVMFWSRNATGSILAAYASSSISCS